MSRSVHGFRRPDGRVGVRNHVLVVPTVICSAVVAERIAAAIAPIGTALPHLAGCGQLGPDLQVTHDTLAAYCAPSQRRRRARRRAGLRAGRRAVSRRRRAAVGQAGAHRLDSGRGRHRARDRARHRDRAPAGRRRRAAIERELVPRRRRSSCR